MKRALLTIVATVCVFAAGVFAGRWMQRTQPLPAPPMGIMGEIRDVPLSGSPGGDASIAKTAREISQIKVEIERLKPEVEEFKKKLEPIKAQFRSDLEAVLSPEQRGKLKNLSERSSTPSTGAEGPPRKRHRDGLDSLFPIVVIPSTLEKLTVELELTAEQQTAIYQLLLRRRTEFLHLVDTSPPPSLKLGRIAPMIPRVAKPEAK